jgi:penicillin-insensitive murein endopeptidase
MAKSVLACGQSESMNLRAFLPLLISAAVVSATAASAQDRGSVDPKPLPPLANPNDPKIGARELFARKLLPAAMPTRSIGSYVRGCIAGAERMPINGDTWQVMRLSRNRNWGHPDMIALLKRLSVKAHKDAGWPGILVGDIGQPRGGPALSGHASHQLGLDADIWLTPMPDHMLSRQDREEMSAVMMVRPDRLDVDPRVFTPGHLAVIRDAAQEPAVQRIFVNAAIKKALCREAKGDRSWLSKVRPWWGHDYHFHIRIKCPAGSTQCEGQPEPAAGEGCSAGDLAYWFKDSVLHPPPPKEPPKPRPPMTLVQLPAACRQVLAAPDAKP